MVLFNFVYFMIYPVKSDGSVLFREMLCGAFDRGTSVTESLSENEKRL